MLLTWLWLTSNFHIPEIVKSQVNMLEWRKTLPIAAANHLGNFFHVSLAKEENDYEANTGRWWRE